MFNIKKLVKKITFLELIDIFISLILGIGGAIILKEISYKYMMLLINYLNFNEISLISFRTFFLIFSFGLVLLIVFYQMCYKISLKEKIKNHFRMIISFLLFFGSPFLVIYLLG